MAATDIQLSPELQTRLTLEEIPYTEEDLEKAYNGIYNRYIKRILDFSLALVGLLIIWPVLFILAVAVALDTGLPILYCPSRGGYRGRPFRICKFRTMVQNADQIGGGTTALNDSRITATGAVYRKMKLDETAQLFNVLAGTMSFIGPRPELLKYTDAYQGLEKNILNVRPGITDFSSINFINLDEIVGSENADEMYEKYVLKKKNQLRLKYVAEVSFRTDVKIFVSTVFHVIKKAVGVIRRKT